MANTGNHTQHVKAGQESHKNTDSKMAGKDTDWSQTSSNASSRNQSNDLNSSSRSGSGTQGGTHDQHVNAGRQSHKNS